jgi:hypothetical protein
MASKSKPILYIVWIVAMLLVGVGIGLYINQTKGQTAQAPSSTTTVTASVVPAKEMSASITGVGLQQQPTLAAVTTTGTVYQAQAGNTFQTLSVQAFQPSSQPAELSPGYTNYVPPQGTVGTTPAK